MHQLKLLDPPDPQPPQSLRLELDDDTLREVVALMAEAIRAVVRSCAEDDDER